MSEIKINQLVVKNYRSFWAEQTFHFPKNHKKPIAIIWYNNSWKTNLINAIRYWLFEQVKEETLDLNDFHNLKWENTPSFKAEYTEFKPHLTDNTIPPFPVTNTISDTIILDASAEGILKVDSHWSDRSKWDIKRDLKIFYINFHNIKEEISTKKWSWWKLKGVLGKHIQKIIIEDERMRARKMDFTNAINQASKNILEWKESEENIEKQWKSKLSNFIDKIKNNYEHNLRNSSIEINFGMPDYEDIFLQMMFRIWLNWSEVNLVPISHFWDWYISMFVMAVIQAIAEENDDKCLFLFEEPESFLHENHQEYFYKQVLCSLSEDWHQVIYTTHSDKMVDIFNTQSIIRLETDEKNQTVSKYNNILNLEVEDYNLEEPINILVYNQYIKSIEPNLNRILFSKKVVLVEWPNDLMVYKYFIEKEVEKLDTTIKNKTRYAETYLNFKNISIIPHHGKHTVHLLIQLCNHFKLDYFVINDLDTEENVIEDLSKYSTLVEMQEWEEYQGSDKNKKGLLTTNYWIIKASKEKQFHFNIPKLEDVIELEWVFDKDSLKIWESIQGKDFWSKLFPDNLRDFLELWKINLNENPSRWRVHSSNNISVDDLPF